MKPSLIVVLIIFLANTACQQKQSNASNLDLPYTYLKAEQKVNPRILGVWKSIGNGYYLEARPDSILLYSYTKTYCYKEKNDYLEGLLNTQSRFEMRDDTLGLYLTDYGTSTHFLQAKKDFIKIEEIPNTCISFNQMTKLSDEDQFNLYLETLEENYAFSDRRNLN
ncbi:MAG: hypothetical protein AAFO07_11130 [Bacteroidota bacterium]